MGNRGFPPPNEAAPAGCWGGHLPRSMDLATARQIHGPLIHVCAPPSGGPRAETGRKRCVQNRMGRLDPRLPSRREEVWALAQYGFAAERNPFGSVRVRVPLPPSAAPGLGHPAARALEGLEAAGSVRVQEEPRREVLLELESTPDAQAAPSRASLGLLRLCARLAVLAGRSARECPQLEGLPVPPPRAGVAAVEAAVEAQVVGMAATCRAAWATCLVVALMPSTRASLLRDTESEGNRAVDALDGADVIQGRVPKLQVNLKASVGEKTATPTAASTLAATPVAATLDSYGSSTLASDGRVVEVAVWCAELRPGLRVGLWYPRGTVWHERLLLYPAGGTYWWVPAPYADRYVEDVTGSVGDGCDRVFACTLDGTARRWPMARSTGAEEAPGGTDTPPGDAAPLADAPDMGAAAAAPLEPPVGCAWVISSPGRLPLGQEVVLEASSVRLDEHHAMLRDAGAWQIAEAVRVGLVGSFRGGRPRELIRLVEADLSARGHAGAAPEGEAAASRATVGAPDLGDGEKDLRERLGVPPPEGPQEPDAGEDARALWVQHDEHRERHKPWREVAREVKRYTFNYWPLEDGLCTAAASMTSRLYVRLVKLLYSKGMLVYLDERERQEEVGVSFVAKKSNQLRLIIDARRSNLHFTSPPGVSLAIAEGLSRIEVGQTAPAPGSFEDLGFTLGTSDISDAFAASGRMTGATLSGRRVAADQRLVPACAALPMGFTWPLFFCLEVGEATMGSTPELEHAHRMSDRGPTTVLRPRARLASGGGAQCTHVDNLGAMGFGHDAVASSLAAAAKRFDEAGLSTRETEIQVGRGETLGCVLDGRLMATRLTAKRYWRARQGLSWALGCRALPGWAWEIILGHCTCCAMCNRDLLAIFNATYKFTRALRDLMPLLRGDWALPWRPLVCLSDASEHGCAVSASFFELEAVKEIGRAQEHSRFRRLGGHSARAHFFEANGIAMTGEGLLKSASELDEHDDAAPQMERSVDRTFKEMDAVIFSGYRWTEIVARGWHSATEDILVRESRALLRAAEFQCSLSPRGGGHIVNFWERSQDDHSSAVNRRLPEHKERADDAGCNTVNYRKQLLEEQSKSDHKYEHLGKRVSKQTQMQEDVNTGNSTGAQGAPPMNGERGRRLLAPPSEGGSVPAAAGPERLVERSRVLSPTPGSFPAEPRALARRGRTLPAPSDGAGQSLMHRLTAYATFPNHECRVFPIAQAGGAEDRRVLDLIGFLACWSKVRLAATSDPRRMAARSCVFFECAEFQVDEQDPNQRADWKLPPKRRRARDALGQGEGAEAFPVAPLPQRRVRRRVSERWSRGGDGEGPLSEAELWDPDEGAWRPLPPMSSARDGCAAAALGGRLLVAAGWDGRRELASAEFYDPELGAWEPGPALRRARRGCAAAVVDGRAYVLGGVAKGELISEVEVLDPGSGRWEVCAVMPTARAGCAAAVVALG
ncbi:unnamed protein product [Prorocentrum cordatum]|uniref:Uncharacterized protein n=1 Tax=Prorocentrum cordatum TaxID=2364126 RepID=A0ABN9T8G3_9DINO|nr:unnamed protein product [Polarella glacialis]